MYQGLAMSDEQTGKGRAEEGDGRTDAQRHKDTDNERTSKSRKGDKRADRIQSDTQHDCVFLFCLRGHCEDAHARTLSTNAHTIHRGFFFF